MGRVRAWIYPVALILAWMLMASYVLAELYSAERAWARGEEPSRPAEIHPTPLANR